MSQSRTEDGGGPRSTEPGGQATGRPVAFESSRSGARRITSTTVETASAALDLARRNYAAGRHEAVLHDLEEPARDLAAFVESVGADAPSGMQAIRLAAAAWSLQARAAARICQTGVATEAAERALGFFDLLKATTESISGEELSGYAIALYLAGRLDAAADAMGQAVARLGASPELYVYKGVLERNRGQLEDAVTSLGKASSVEALDLQQLRLETLALALTALRPDKDEEAVKAYSDLANLHLRASRYPEALESIEKARAIKGDDVYVLSDRAEILRRMGRIDDALVAFDEALAIQSDFTWALARKGVALHQAEKYEEALVVLDRAVDLDPSDAYVLANKGETLRSLGRFEEAIATFDAALAIVPDYEWALALKGEALRQAERYDEALAVLDQALGLEPADAFALASKAETLRNLSRFDEAIKTFDAALAIRPVYLWALGRKGEALREASRYEESVAELDKALALDPNYVWALTSKGDALRRLGRLEEAIRIFDAALAIAPDDTWALARRGEALLHSGRYEEALKSFEASPDDASSAKWKGEALRMLGRLEEAVAVFDEALARKPDDAWTLASKGSSLRGLGKAHEAEQILRRAIELEPENLFALGNLALCLTDQGRNQEALEVAENVLQRSSSDDNALEAKALALMQLDDIDQALVAIAKRLEVETESAWARGARGVMLMQIEANEEAAGELARSIEQNPGLAWVQSALAECYTRLSFGKPRPEQLAALSKAETAGRSAVQLEPGDPTWHRMLAEVLWRRSAEHRREAVKEFEQVLELVRAKDKLDFFEAQSAGWAAFRLSFDESRDGRTLLAEAERYFVDALSTKKQNPNSSDAISVQFNLALTALSSGRTGLALREYDRVLELARKLQWGLHRGVVGRAREDLEQLMLDRPQFTDERYVRRLLETLGHDYSRKEEQGPEGSLAVEEASEDVAQAGSLVHEATVPAKS